MAEEKATDRAHTVCALRDRAPSLHKGLALWTSSLWTWEIEDLMWIVVVTSMGVAFKSLQFQTFPHLGPWRFLFCLIFIERLFRQTMLTEANPFAYEVISHDFCCDVSYIPVGGPRLRWSESYLPVHLLAFICLDQNPTALVCSMIWVPGSMIWVPSFYTQSFWPKPIAPGPRSLFLYFATFCISVAMITCWVWSALVLHHRPWKR